MCFLLRQLHFFLLASKETEAKKNALCQGQTGLFVDEGIFREGILPSRKTPHIHVRRPPGLQASPGSVGSLEAESNGNGNGNGKSHVASRTHAGVWSLGRSHVLGSRSMPASTACSRRASETRVRSMRRPRSRRKAAWR